MHLKAKLGAKKLFIWIFYVKFSVLHEIIKFYYFGINSLLTAHSNTIYTLAVNTTGGTPEEKASRHVTLVGTTNMFTLNYRKFNCFALFQHIF
jgi:hypothetical protein